MTASTDRPTEGRACLSVWVRGEVWSYREGSTRIYSFGGDEINVWDHAAGAPGIEFTREGIEARVEEWLDDQAEADQVQREADEDAERALAGNERPGTPEGMTDEEWAVERFGWNGDNA